MDPATFWTSSLGEVGAMLGRREQSDKQQWVHTGHMLALTANLNRRKGAKAAAWSDFAPYDYSEPAYAVEEVTREHFEQGKDWAAQFSKS